jgi:hypothetical protein
MWCTPLHHLLAWGLSLRLARRHYPETMLVTDRAGKKLLVEQLGLPFVHVSTELERLAPVDPGWWALGKLIAYGLQDRPFVHVDTDVFLWKPLPKAVAQSPVFTQCPEFYANDSKPSLRAIEQAFSQHGNRLPVEWKWARSRGKDHFREENCGILGGTHVDFIRHYSRTALDLALRPENGLAWSQLPDKTIHNFTVEQFFLAACLDFHNSHPASDYRGVTVGHLFSSVAEACDISRAARAGFTHLWGSTKSHPAVGRRLEERMRREDPAYFRRCEKVSLANS